MPRVSKRALLPFSRWREKGPGDEGGDRAMTILTARPGPQSQATRRSYSMKYAKPHTQVFLPFARLLAVQWLPLRGHGSVRLLMVLIVALRA